MMTRFAWFVQLATLLLVLPPTVGSMVLANEIPEQLQGSAYSENSDKIDSYRQRLVGLMARASFIKRQWRERRCYPHTQRAMDLTLRGRKEEALRIYDTYLEKDPEHLMMQWDRLMLLETLNNPLKTESAASHFLSHAPGFGPALILRGFARKRLHQFQGAESDWAAALKDDQLAREDRTLALSELLFSSYRRRDLQAALNWCERLMSENPQTAERYAVFRADLLQALQRWEPAVDQWRGILLTSRHPATLRQAALACVVLLQKTGRSGEALAMLTRADLERVFDLPETPARQRRQFYATLALLAEKAGRNKTALAAFEKMEAGALDQRDRLNLARLCALGGKPARIIPLLYPEKGQPPKDVAALNQILDLIHLLEHHGSTSTAMALLQKAMPSVKRLASRRQGSKKTKALLVAYLALQARYARVEGRYQEAERSLAHLADLTGECRYQLDYAALLLANDRSEEAIDILSAAAAREDFSAKERCRAFADLASALMRNRRFPEAARAWEGAYQFSLNPTFKLYAIDAWRMTGDLSSAAARLERFPVERLTLQERQVFYETAGRIRFQQGDDRAAVELFEHLLATGRKDPQTFADLGFIYTRLNENDLALRMFRQAVDRTLAVKPSNQANLGEDIDALRALRAQIAELDRDIEWLLAESLHAVREDDLDPLSSSKQWFNQGIGMIEVGWRPAPFGYRSGRTTTLFARLLWPNQPASLRPDGDALQAGLGIKHKPFANSNLLLSTEWLKGLGCEIEDQFVLRMAHSKTSMPWTSPASPKPGSFLGRLSYRHFYTDTGKVFGDQDYWFVSHETRLGAGFETKYRARLLPFGYLQASSIFRQDKDLLQVESGLGCSIRRSGAFDRYKGARCETEILLRAGYIGFDSNDGEGLSALVGLRLHFF